MYKVSKSAVFPDDGAWHKIVLLQMNDPLLFEKEDIFTNFAKQVFCI